jgi:hypothetical protein
MMLVGMIGECARMVVARIIEARDMMTFDATIGACDLMIIVETIGPCGRTTLAAKEPCARTILAEKNGKAIATNLGEMIVEVLTMNGSSVLEETKMSRESVFGRWKRRKCAKGVDGTKAMREIDDHATMIVQ